ncbi:hypothetical protein ANTRET_LOCUS5227 [Anthophora retusa]
MDLLTVIIVWSFRAVFLIEFHVYRKKLSNKFNVFYVTLTGNSWPKQREVQNKRKAQRKKHRSVNSSERVKTTKFINFEDIKNIEEKP